MIRHLLTAARSRRQAFDALVRYVAEASVDGAVALVGNTTADMSPAEARGYIRGRAGREVRRQARIALARRPEAAPQWAEALAHRAAERVPALVLRRLAAATDRKGATRGRAA